MAITNTKSLFATEQPVLGNEKRDVKQGTLDTIFNFNYETKRDDYIKLDFSNPEKNGIIARGVESIFEGDETFNVNGYTGFIYVQFDIIDATAQGGSFTINASINQGVNVPADVVNDPSYVLHKGIFAIEEGRISPFEAQYFSGFRYEITTDDLLEITLSGTVDKIPSDDQNVEFIADLSGSAGGVDTPGLSMSINANANPNTASGTLTRASFKDYGSFSGFTENVSGSSFFTLTKTKGQFHEARINLDTFNDVVRITGDYQDGNDSGGKIVTNGRVTGRIISGSIGTNITVLVSTNFDGRIRMKDIFGNELVNIKVISK